MGETKPKRIVRIVSQLNISGPALQAVLLTSALRDTGYDCILIGGTTPHDSDSMRYIADEYDIEPIIVPEFAYSNPTGAIPAIWRLQQFIQ